MTTFFPHLKTLELKSLPLLKSVDDQLQSGQVIDDSWSFCQYPKKIKIQWCHALSSLIPWYAVGQMKRLQELVIWNCKTMTEIFESASRTNNNAHEGSAHGDASLTSIFTLVVPQLSNLKDVKIDGCDLLTHVFTFSTLESLKQLKALKVSECKAMQVIVKEENGTSSKAVQVFPRLQTLELDDLPNLKGFFLGVNEFKWPSLDDVMIKDCPQLTVFTSSESKTQKLKYIHSNIGKHTLESCGLNFQTTFPTSSEAPVSKRMSWSYHNLIEINRECTFVKNSIPCYALPQLQKLEKIHLEVCCEIEEVFEVELEGRNNNNSGFNESQTTDVVKVPNLKQVYLFRVDDLKYLWKSTKWLVLEFPNLTTVDIVECDKLEHVFTCSMVGSLVQLQNLSLSMCHNVEVIVKEEDKKECDDKVNEIIMLPHLKSLKLGSLSKLKGFCIGKHAFSLVALDTLEITRCSTIAVFTKGYLSIPKLKEIDTRFGKYYVKPDLNSFIKIKQEEGYEF